MQAAQRSRKQKPTPPSAEPALAPSAREEQAHDHAGSDGTSTSPRQGAASTLKGAASAAAANAVRGALTGGAAGAARAIAVGAFKDPNSRKILATAAIAIIVIFAVTIMLINSGLSSIAASMLSEQENINSRSSAEQAGVDEETLEQVVSTEHGNVPWPVQAAALDTNPDADLAALEAKLDELDPSREYRSFTVYATRADHTAVMTQQLDENPGKDYYSTHKSNHLEAFQAAGLSESEAATAYTLATRISLGADLCRADGGGTVEPSGEFTYDGRTYSTAQVVNMKTIIGVSKTMAGGDWEAAARIGLITARVESSFQNYANDGVVGPEDRNMGGFTADDYAQLAYSLTLPHDAVGSDHASVGIMQQQATMGWGAAGESNFRTDPEGVIKRLMTPAFAAGKFLQRVLEITGWQTAEPGSIAQQVQVSDFPDRYREQVPLADAIIAEFGSSQPGIDVPAEVGWNGTGNSGDTNGDGNTSSRCGESGPGGELADGDAQQLAQKLLDYADQGRLIWFADDAEGLDQITAYANGGPIREECTLDVRVLQLLVMGTEMFNKISINSLNRRCTGSTPGAGKASYHWKGQAADIGFLNGKSTTGDPAIPEAHQFWQRFAEVASNSGGGLGQVQCRGGQRYEGVANFVDGCNHLHFEIGRDGNTEPLKG